MKTGMLPIKEDIQEEAETDNQTPEPEIVEENEEIAKGDEENSLSDENE